MMSAQRLPLDRRKPGAVAIIKRARTSAESKGQIGEDGLVRLEAAMLAEGAVQPWPATLVTLATGASPEFAQGTVNAYAALAKGLASRDRFSVGAQVLALKYVAGSTVSHWSAGIISRKLAGRRFDVKLLDGDTQRNMRQQEVLAPSTGGAGAVLREAARMGSAALVDALLRKGISVFESDYEAITPLHLASAAGHADVCNLLVDAGADGLTPDMRGLTSCTHLPTTRSCPLHRGIPMCTVLLVVSPLR